MTLSSTPICPHHTPVFAESENLTQKILGARTEQASHLLEGEETSVGAAQSRRGRSMSMGCLPCAKTSDLLGKSNHTAAADVRPKHVPSPQLAGCSSAVRNAVRMMPHLPDEIGLMVLEQAQAYLNPVLLLTLIDSDKDANIPSFLSRVACDDRFWTSFSDKFGSGKTTCHAQAFARRYKAMSQRHKTVLQDVWAGRLSAGELLKNQAVLSFDFDIVMAAVLQDGMALRYAAPCLQGHRDIVRAAVSQHGGALKYASAALQSERDIVMSAVCRHGRSLEYAALCLRGDAELVLQAVRQNGLALLYAAAALRGERDIVLAAVCQNGWALKHAARRLRADEQIVCAAVGRYGFALCHAAPAMQQERAVVMLALCQNGIWLRFAAASMQADRDVVLVAVRSNGLALEFAAEERRAERDIVIAALGQNRRALRYAAAALRYDPAVLAAANVVQRPKMTIV